VKATFLEVQRQWGFLYGPLWSTGLDNGTDWDDNDIMETHLAG